MKTNFFKKVLATMLAFMMAVLPLTGVEADAASKPYMKTLNVKWDLEPEKEVTYKTKYSGITPLQKGKVKIKNYKIIDAKKEGYKKLTFTVVFKPKRNFTANQIHKIADTGSVGGDTFITLVDYKTGKCLEGKNDYGVTVKFGDVEWLDEEVLEDEHGCWVSVFKTIKLKVTVTYPEDYKELCIAVGGQTDLENKNANKFYAGEVKFGKTSYVSKKDKDVAHVMLVK